MEKIQNWDNEVTWLPWSKWMYGWSLADALLGVTKKWEMVRFDPRDPDSPKVISIQDVTNNMLPN